MELTQEHFDDVIKNAAFKEDLKPLATKDYVDAKTEELFFLLTDALAAIEDAISPDFQLINADERLKQIEKLLHIES